MTDHFSLSAQCNFTMGYFQALRLLLRGEMHDLPRYVSFSDNMVSKTIRDGYIRDISRIQLYKICQVALHGVNI